MITVYTRGKVDNTKTEIARRLCKSGIKEARSSVLAFLSERFIKKDLEDPYFYFDLVYYNAIFEYLKDIKNRRILLDLGDVVCTVAILDWEHDEDLLILNCVATDMKLKYKVEPQLAEISIPEKAKVIPFLKRKL